MKRWKPRLLIKYYFVRMGQKLSLPDLHNSYQMVMIGLDNAGKSTLLYRLKMDQYIQAIPTVGFNCEKIKPNSGKAKNSTFVIWDVGGQEKLRPLWRTYIRHADAVIFVVDSTDEDRFEEAKLELSNLVRSPDFPGSAPVVLFANKQDLPTALLASDVEHKVGMTELGPGHSCEAVACCAITGEGLDDIFDTLHEAIQKSRKLDKGKKKTR